MKSTSTTEQEMRVEVAPTPKTTAELSEYIESLVDRKHDYGTCVYAMSLAATAAFNMVASKLGVTGFQASCADMDILTRTRMLKGPWMIVKAEDALYPQKDPMKSVRAAVDGWKGWLADEAKKKLAEVGRAHPDVMEHWIELAYPDGGSEYQELCAKADFLRHKFTPEFVETNVAEFKRFGLLEVYFSEEESVALAETCKEGCCVRLGVATCLDFTREIDGIKTSWSIDTEPFNSNGKPTLHIDFDKLAKMEAEATNPEVKAAIQAYTAKARG